MNAAGAGTYGFSKPAKDRGGGVRTGTSMDPILYPNLNPPPPPGEPPSLPSPGRSADDAFGVILIGTGILCLSFVVWAFLPRWRTLAPRKQSEQPPLGAPAGMRMPELQDASFRFFLR